MKRHGLQDQRGSVLLFTTLLLVLLIGMGGLAIDLSYLAAARGELQRSMDAAALAGAGNLGFDDTVFPTVRQEAWRFGNLNPYRVGTVNLNLNAANAANGDIVLGIWDGANFTPSLDGTQVNAVQCQFATQIPTAFTRVLGFATLPVSARAIAVSDPPLTVEESECVFPIALSCCAFAVCSGSNSLGCGQPVTFITSSGGEDCIAPPCTNTATWANVCDSGTPNVPQTIAAIQDAGSGTCSSCTPEADGVTDIGTNNGMQQPVFNALAEEFLAQYNNGGIYDVTDSTGYSTYTGPGWKVTVPVIRTPCPAQAINGPRELMGWSSFVMTAVVNKGTCVPENPADAAAIMATYGVQCPDTGEPAMRAVFGYYSCDIKTAPPDRVVPGPRSALADRLRLVQ